MKEFGIKLDGVKTKQIINICFSYEDWKVKRVKNYPDKKGNKRPAKLLFD